MSNLLSSKTITNSVKKTIRPLTTIVASAVPASLKANSPSLSRSRSRSLSLSLSSVYGWCLPSKIYGMLAIIVIIVNLIYLGYPGFDKFIVPIIYNVFFTWCMSLLCNNGWMKVAWMLTAISIIITLFYTALLYRRQRVNEQKAKKI